MLQQETCRAFSLNNTLLSAACRLVLRPLISAATYTGTSPHEVNQLRINHVCCRLQHGELYLGNLLSPWSNLLFWTFFFLSITQQHNLARHLKEVSSAGHPLSNLSKRIKGVIDTHSTTSHFDESNECKEEHPPPRQNYPARSLQKDRSVIQKPKQVRMEAP